MGQVIETVRGGGIFQPAIDEAIKKLQAGDWVSGSSWRLRWAGLDSEFRADAYASAGEIDQYLSGRIRQSTESESSWWSKTIQMGRVSSLNPTNEVISGA